MEIQDEFTMPTEPSAPLIPVKGMEYFEHQEIAIRWMLQLETAGYEYRERIVNGGILADDMGLGKTLEIIGLIKNGGQLAHQTLIVAPLALLDNWIRMSVRAKFGVWIFNKGEWEEHSHSRKGTTQQVYVINYEKLLVESNREKIQEFVWDRIVLDEAHRIRNAGTRLFNECAALKSLGGRWAVTGTPVVNALTDALSLFKFIGCRFHKMKWMDEKHLELVNALVMHRKLSTLRNIVSDAPPVHEVEEISLPFLTEKEEEWYRGIQGAIRNEIRLLRYRRHLASTSAILKLLLRMRQISVHPQIYMNAYGRETERQPRQWNHGSTKFEAVRGLVEDDMKSTKSDGTPHKYIFICHFRDEMDIVEEFLKEEIGISTVVQYNGEMSQAERADAIEQVEDAEKEAAILVQLQAGGVGLNLQFCDRVIFLSPWWTHALMEQAIARSVRIGQREVVKVWKISLDVEDDARDIDFLIYSAVERKAKLADTFLDAAITIHSGKPVQLELAPALDSLCIANVQLEDADAADADEDPHSV
jgi:SNF2 family DNA or RNA helicase